MIKYKIKREIGRGAFSTVYLAEDASGKPYVVKRYNLSGIRQSRSEYLFLQSLSFTRVPQVSGYQSEKDSSELVMEYLEGNQPQAELFAGRSSLDRFFYELCEQLIMIHGAGICLNDIKPDNLIIKEDGHPWLIDLGLATTNNYNDGIFRGSLAYSSPEKYKHSICNFASDIFSVGMLYYELESGSHPAADMAEGDWQKLLGSKQEYNLWLADSGLDEGVKALLAYEPAGRATALTSLRLFAGRLGITPDIRSGLIDEYIFSGQRKKLAQLFAERKTVCNPQDEPELIANQAVLRAESEGRQLIIIKETELLSDPEQIIERLNQITDNNIKRIEELNQLNLDGFYILLQKKEGFSSMLNSLKEKSQVLCLEINEKAVPLSVSAEEFAAYCQTVDTDGAVINIPEDSSVMSARLYLRSKLLSQQNGDVSRLVRFIAEINYPVPLELVEQLEDNWVEQLAGAITSGLVAVSGGQITLAQPLEIETEGGNWAQYHQKAVEHGYLLYAGLISILSGELDRAIEEFSIQYRNYIKKRYLVSAWQLLSLLEERAGWEKLNFKLQKAKAFLLVRMDAPDEAVTVYKKVSVQPGSREEAIIQNDLGIALQANRQLSEAAVMYEKAEAYFRRTGEMKAVLRAMNNAAAIYYEQKELAQATQIYMRILDETEKIEDREYSRNYRLVSQINLADIFLHRAEWKRSLFYAQKAVQFATENDLIEYKAQAEVIAVMARFALEDPAELAQVCELLLSDNNLVENEQLWEYLAGQILYIQYYHNAAAAEKTAAKLLLRVNEYSEEQVKLSLFCYLWQTRQIETAKDVLQLMAENKIREYAEILYRGKRNELSLLLPQLSRQEDSWQYIYFAFIIAGSGLHLQQPEIASELLALQKVYSFAPLEKVMEPAVNEPPAHLQKLWEIVTLIHNNTDYTGIIEAVLKGLIGIADLDRAIFFTYQDGALKPQRAIDGGLNELSEDRIQVSQTILLDALESNEVQFMSGLQEEEQVDIYSSIFGLGLRSAVCYPLRFGETLEGVIYSDARADRQFDVEEKKLLTSLFFQARSALEKVFLIQSYQQQQMTMRNMGESDLDGSIIGSSEAMRKVFQMINLVGEHNVNVLISGETGTGKELVARALHKRYAADKPFTPLNCAAIPENLLESELFGYSKGAFTGADKDKKGLIEQTRGGTLFLDEIGDMPLGLQAKLLRVIQERKVTPLGSGKSVDIDVRVISATNVALVNAVEKGTFRQDLYYRLKVIQIDIPPLAERQEDIPLLVQHFIERYNKRFSRQVKRVSPEAMQMLQNRIWHGNVRELENEIERAMVLCQQSELTLELFDTSSLKREFSLGDNMPLGWDSYKGYRKQFSDNLDGIYIKKLMKAAGDNIANASRLAKISRTQLYRLLDKKE